MDNGQDLKSDFLKAAASGLSNVIKSAARTLANHK
jgi:hypothetical protein